MIKNIKNAVSWTNVISVLNGKEILEALWKRIAKTNHRKNATNVDTSKSAKKDDLSNFN